MEVDDEDKIGNKMNPLGKDSLTDTPCIGICSTAIGDDICIGCRRTFTEVNNWNTFSDAEKITINIRLNEERRKK